MSTNEHNLVSSQTHTTPIPTDHAQERWAERASGVHIQLGKAWHEAIEIESSELDYEQARLYSPADVVLIMKEQVIVTVVPANYDTLDTAALCYCPHCENLYRLTHDGTCHWCGRRRENVRTAGNINISYQSDNEPA